MQDENETQANIYRKVSDALARMANELVVRDVLFPGERDSFLTALSTHTYTASDQEGVTKEASALLNKYISESKLYTAGPIKSMKDVESMPGSAVSLVSCLFSHADAKTYAAAIRGKK